MLFKRATPMPPFAYFFGKLAMAVLFALIMVSALFILGATAGGVPPARRDLALPAGRAGRGHAAVRRLRARGGLLGGTQLGGGRAQHPRAAGGVRLRDVDPDPDAAAGGQAGSPSSSPPITTPSSRCTRSGSTAAEPPARHVVFLAGVHRRSLLLAWIGYRRDDGKTFG